MDSDRDVFTAREDRVTCHYPLSEVYFNRDSKSGREVQLRGSSSFSNCKGTKMIIKKVCGREVLDSRGNPTVEVDVILEYGSCGRAAVPSGASTGKFEALELRDGDNRFHGKGVKKAVSNVNKIIAPVLEGMEALWQEEVDQKLIELDGTENKSKLGANAILGASLATARAAANSLGFPLFKYIAGMRSGSLPIPLLNILNGGVHADNNLDIQEFMIVPLGAKSFREAMRMGSEVFHTLKDMLKDRNLSTSVGDEGGFAPDLNENKEALELIVGAIEESGYSPGKDICLALDSAASSFYQNNKYRLEGKDLRSSELIELYKGWVGEFPIISIEDGLSEEDWAAWAEMTERLGERIRIVGDDLFVTNTDRLNRGIKQGVANSILIKPNQIGTLTEALQAMEIAKKAGYTAIVSHRSGETEDTFIADLAVGTGCGWIKTGSASRGERIAKYNRLLRIEEEFNLKFGIGG